MATKIKDAAVVTSKFTSNGQEKSRWKNVGALYQKDDGSLFLGLHAFFNYAALKRNEDSDYFIIPLFEPKKRDDSNSNSNSISDSFGFSSGSNDSDIPF